MAESASSRIEGATIDALHAAIKSGQTTCVAVVAQYIEPARAYNGVASLLVTKDGAPDRPCAFRPKPSTSNQFSRTSTNIKAHRSNSAEWRRRLLTPQ